MAYLLHGPKVAASRQVARVLRSDPEKGESLLHELCDQLLGPEKPRLDSSEMIEWLKVLFEEETFEKFCNKVHNMDCSSLCGCVWTAHFVAYRCRTCATSPCMSLCAACFEKGNHTGHDYNIFRSEAGGACDCGDASVMRPSGFCSHHGPNRVPPLPQPQGFLTAGKVLLDRMFLAVIQMLRTMSVNLSENPDYNFPSDYDQFLAFLLELIKLGSPVRSHITKLLLNETLYSDINQCKGYKCLEDVNSTMHTFHKKTIQYFNEAIRGVDHLAASQGIRNSDQITTSRQYKNYLDEIMFWIVQYKFPESLILVMLNLLPDMDMKREFSIRFTRHYTLIAASLSNTTNVDQLSNRVVHISVQLFSNDQLAHMLATKENLLQIFMFSMHNIIAPNLVPSNTVDIDFHQCVSCSSEDMKSNTYWPIVTDFVNVLSHRSVTTLFLSDVELLNYWFQEIVCFSCMALSRRALDAHIEFEPATNQVLVAYYTEREACASPLWCMLAVLEDGSTAELSISVISCLREVLAELFDALGYDATHPLPYNQISFHYPLHRYMAHFISNAIKKQGVTFKDLKISQETAIMFMAHPLQMLVTTFEINCDMWVRNGTQMQSQSLAHKQHLFCKFFIDADLYMLQFCACILPPDYVVAAIFERCRVISSLKLCDMAVLLPHIYSPGGNVGEPTEEKLLKMLEAAFNILQYILSIKYHTGLSDEELVRAEIIAVLAAKPSTYSSLTDYIPQNHDSHSGAKIRHYTAILNQTLHKYAKKREGNAMEQTTYVPNAEAWKLYDPVFTQFRALYKREVQQAHISYVQHLSTDEKIEPPESETNYWPPFLPMHQLNANYRPLGDLLHSRVLHGFVFIVLYNHSTVTDATLAMALHMLEAALSLPKSTGPDRSPRPGQWFYDEWYAPIRDWFDTTDPYTNIMKIVSFDRPSSLNRNDPIFKDLISPDSRVHTGESIVSLLIKLYSKLSGQNRTFILDDARLRGQEEPIFRPPSRENVVSRILHMAAANNKLVEQTIRVISKAQKPPLSVSTPSPSGSDFSVDEKAVRRKKAQEARSRLLQQFQQKQQQFIKSAQKDVELMEAAGNTSASSCDLTETDAAAAMSAQDWGLETLPQYECVICGQVETELDAMVDDGQAENKLMGLVCFLQPSMVLGHRTDSPKNLSHHKLSARFKSYTADCRFYVLRRRQCWKSLQAAKLTTPDAFRDQNLLATAIGSHISTCGHRIHLACHNQYMETVHQDETSFLRFDMLRGFRCPLCRQTSNFVLPCNIRQKQTSREGIPDYRTIVSKVWLDSYNDMTTINKAAAIGGLMAPFEGSETGHPLLLVALVRFNIENHLMQIKHSLKQSLDEKTMSPRSTSLTRKAPVGPLFMYFLRVYKFKTLKEDKQKQSAQVERIRGRLEGREGAPTSSEDTPLLVNDPVTLLIQLTAESPLLLPSFQSNVQLLFPLVFVQALVNISCKFSPEERRAWKNNVSVSVGGIPFSGDSLDSLMGVVIRLLPMKFYESTPGEGGVSSTYPTDGYSTTVFSPQSVSSELEEITINFLQLASLLQYHLFNLPEGPITSSCDSQFGHLASYLGLCKGLDVHAIDPIKCLKWDKPRTTITQWCSKVSAFYRSSEKIISKLLTFHKPWSSPKLVDLPQEYSTLFQTYSKMECHACKIVPKEAALCLVCGEHLCYIAKCKPADSHSSDDLITIPEDGPDVRTETRSCCRHARRCGAGTCILLVVNSSDVIIIRGTRACVWGTLYLDAHGEEDRGWRRGKPLFLKKERMDLLESQWVQHLFDNSVKDWSAHRNHL